MVGGDRRAGEQPGNALARAARRRPGAIAGGGSDERHRSRPAASRRARARRRPSSAPPSAPPPQPQPPARDFEVPIQLLAGLATFCTALCLGNLFDGVRWWLLPVTGGIVVAGLAGELSRRVQGLAVVMPLVYLVAGWLYVIPVATHGSPYSSKISLAPVGHHLERAALAGELRLQRHPNAERPGARAAGVPVPDRGRRLPDRRHGRRDRRRAAATGGRRAAFAGAARRSGGGRRPRGRAARVPRGLRRPTWRCCSRRGDGSLTRWARLPAGTATGIRRATGPDGPPYRRVLGRGGAAARR